MTGRSFRSLIAGRPSGHAGFFACIQADFTHAIGVPPGTYPVAGGTVLISDVVQADAAARRRGGEESRGAVALAVITLVLADRPFADEAAARGQLSALRAAPGEQAELVDELLATINVAAHAYRVTAGDPYVIDVSAHDARTWRAGVSSAEALGEGRFLESFEVSAPAPAERSKGPSVEELQVLQSVSDALAERTRFFDAEDVALRAQLDFAHGRTAGGIAQARAAAQVLRDELRLEAAELPAELTAAEAEAIVAHVLETAAAYRRAAPPEP